MIQNPEQAFREVAEAEGWDVTKRGWPDFLCRRNGQLMAVEVKGPRDGLSPQQYETISDLRRAGIPTFVWGPDTGYVEVGPPVGESIFTERATIAHLKAALSAKEQSQHEPKPDVVRWSYQHVDGPTIKAVAVWCLSKHPNHARRKQLGTSGSWCSDVAILMRRHSDEKIHALSGMPSLSKMRVSTQKIRDFMVAWQHERVHRSIALGQRCTGCP